MADKRSIRHDIKKLQRVKLWQLLILLILAGFIAATFLRLNNTGMVQRRNAVISADKAGDTQQIAERLAELQNYSATHMNAAGGVIYLQHQYDRDAQAAIKAASNSSSESAAANAHAEEVCHPQYSGWSTAYMQCFLAELAKYPTSDKLAEPELPNTELYRYEFVSPLWTPDFAGFSLLVVGLLIFMIFLRLISMMILRILLRRHYRSA